MTNITWDTAGCNCTGMAIARSQTGVPFYQAFFPTTAVNVDSCRGPIAPTFAHHLDADLLGSVLKEACPHVERIIDDVLDVKLNEQGEILR